MTRRRRAGFRPPHCPNRRCRFYRPRSSWRWRRDGFYPGRAASPVARFRCLHCRRRFSRRTFAPTYWLRRPELLVPIAELSVAGSGLRQIGRTLGVSHTTVARHLARAGRHCLLFQAQLTRGRPLPEPIAFDGFETFEYSQFFPFHLNLAAGQQSWFLYHFTDSPLRRKGRMTPAQRERRRELEHCFGRPDPKAVETGIVELLLPLLRAPASAAIRLHSDAHPAYRRALRRLRRECPQLRLEHRRTPSTDPRTRAHPLFAVNLADLLLRHCGANHRRETIAFSKRRQAAIERMAVFTVWRNAIKWRRENRRGETAAMRAGILARPVSWRQVFRRRLFPRKGELPARGWVYYWGRVRTAALGKGQRTHRLRFAF
jgi:transposase-like protein